MTTLIITLTSAAILTAAYFINSSTDSDKCAEALASMNVQLKRA